MKQVLVYDQRRFTTTNCLWHFFSIKLKFHVSLERVIEDLFIFCGLCTLNKVTVLMFVQAGSWSNSLPNPGNS